ncbi:MAG: DUF4013 domain-containing protein [Chitinophagales bacterium]
MLDYGQSLKYPTEDENWIKKVVIGGLINIVPFVNLISVGYALESMRAGIDGQQVLPEWDNWGERFVNGLMVAVISLIYMLVPMAIIVVGTLLGSAGSAMTGSGMAGLAAFGTTSLIGTLVALVIGFFLPMAIANYVAQGNFGAAFEFGVIWNRIKSVMNDYIITFVIYIVAFFILGLLNVIPILGFIIMLLGSFYLLTVFNNIFGQLYRSSNQ